MSELEDDDLPYDALREKFDSLTLPEGVYGHYIGRMAEGNSLGRYLIALCPPEFPIKLNYIRGLEMPRRKFNSNSPEELRDLVGGFAFTYNYKVTNDISAFKIETCFIDVFGNKVMNEEDTIFRESDFTNQPDTSYLEYPIIFSFDGVQEKKSIIREIPGLSQEDFHICVLLISRCRTADGLDIKSSEEFVFNSFDWLFDTLTPKVQ